MVKKAIRKTTAGCERLRYFNNLMRRIAWTTRDQSLE
jgi:hypothetical protein